MGFQCILIFYGSEFSNRSYTAEFRSIIGMDFSNQVDRDGFYTCIGVFSNGSSRAEFTDGSRNFTDFHRYHLVNILNVFL